VEAKTVHEEDMSLKVRYFLRDESGQILRHVVTIGIAFVVIILLIVEIGPIVLIRFSSG
jgi:hypothetical protein